MFNGEKTVEQAIHSALSQDNVEVEIVAVDDCSTDASLRAIREITDHRVRVFQLARNSGPSAARNEALSRATGDWVALLDADDWFSPDRLVRLTQLAETHDLDVVADDQWLWPASGSEQARRRSASLPFLKDTLPIKRVGLEQLFENVGLGIVQPIIRREFLERHAIAYRDTYRYGEDFRLLYELLSKGARMGVTGDALYNARLHESSLTADRVAMFSGMVKVLDDIRQEIAATGSNCGVEALQSAIRQAKETRAYGSVMDPLKQGKLSAAFMALSRNPAFPLQFASRMGKKLIKRVAI